MCCSTRVAGGNAVYDDGAARCSPTDYHAYLRKLNVENDCKTGGSIWMVSSPAVFSGFPHEPGPGAAGYRHRLHPAGAGKGCPAPKSITDHPGGNTSGRQPRFVGALSVYDFCKRFDAQTVLIVTNRPAIANSWYSDYVRFLGRESGYLFVSHVDALAGQPHVLDEQGYLDAAAQGEKLYKRIEFVSLQDMKGSKYFGGEYDKLRHLTELNWDVLVIDEAHEGVVPLDRPSG